MPSRQQALSRVVQQVNFLARIVAPHDKAETPEQVRALQRVYAALEDYEQATARATRGEPPSVHIVTGGKVLCGAQGVGLGPPERLTTALGAQAGQATCPDCLQEWDAMK